MCRYLYSRLLLCGLLLLSLSKGITQENQSPHIILILSDDLGVGDISCYYGKYHTPNIDKIAAEGGRLTNYYSASLVCSPSRAGILTGKSPEKLHFTTFLYTHEDNIRIELEDCLVSHSTNLITLLEV